MKLVLGFLLLSATAQAQDTDWTVDTKLALAQCLVAEAGWDAPVEWSVIAHVLVSRHKSVGWSLLDMTRQYCAMHRAGSPSARQRYIRSLPWGELTHAPPGASRARLAGLWKSVIGFVERFSTTGVPNPLPGAQHWGSREDHGRLTSAVLMPRHVVVGGKTVGLRNYFYRVIRR